MNPNSSVSLDEPVVSPGRRNPPARNTSRFWFERFLAVIQRQNPQTVDSVFLSQIAPSNEGKLLAQLKFLHVIDEQGKATKYLPMLNMVGEEQRRGFQEITRESYADLFNEVKMERAVPDDIVNFFIRKYSFTRDKAVNASKFFLYLAEKGGVDVSQDLSAFLNESVSSATSKSVETQRSPTIRKQKKSIDWEIGRTVPIQATIEIKLDKDTPKEYWDRVIALLSAKLDVESENSE